jgi:hypothetical protein
VEVDWGLVRMRWVMIVLSAARTVPSRVRRKPSVVK